MTNEEAITGLKYLKSIHQNSQLTCEALNIAIKALEKQIPKKPIEAKNIYPPEQFECPVCGSCVGRHKTVKKINDAWGEILTDCKVEFAYCCECGQKQDWSE